jgi:hypothetical protein
MKKSLNEQGKKLQLHKETLKRLAGGATVKPLTDPHYAPGTTDRTCTDYPSAWC